MCSKKRSSFFFLFSSNLMATLLHKFVLQFGKWTHKKSIAKDWRSITVAQKNWSCFDAFLRFFECTNNEKKVDFFSKVFYCLSKKSSSSSTKSSYSPPPLFILQKSSFKSTNDYDLILHVIFYICEVMKKIWRRVWRREKGREKYIARYLCPLQL